MSFSIGPVSVEIPTSVMLLAILVVFLLLDRDDGPDTDNDEEAGS